MAGIRRLVIGDQSGIGLTTSLPPITFSRQTDLFESDLIFVNEGFALATEMPGR
jgi:hypothetical protein